MSKPKFDPSRIQDRIPSGGLEPLDFMKPLDRQESVETTEPSRPAPPAKPDRDKPNTPASDLPMPPARQAEPRVILVSRISPGLNDRLRAFCQAHNASIQDTVTLAVDEFLERRNS
jgi:hypothetical protein